MPPPQPAPITGQRSISTVIEAHSRPTPHVAALRSRSTAVAAACPGRQHVQSPAIVKRTVRLVDPERPARPRWRHRRHAGMRHVCRRPGAGRRRTGRRCGVEQPERATVCRPAAGAPTELQPRRMRRSTDGMAPRRAGTTRPPAAGRIAARAHGREIRPRQPGQMPRRRCTSAFAALTAAGTCGSTSPTAIGMNTMVL